MKQLLSRYRAGLCVLFSCFLTQIAVAQPVFTMPLSIAKNGTGSGAVTSSPAGIDCGATCSGNFTGGTDVVLTAVPAQGSVVSGWSVTFLGNTTVNDTSKSLVAGCGTTTSCTVRMDGDQIVTVTFTAQGVLPSAASVPTLGLLAQILVGVLVGGLGLFLRNRR